MTKLLQLTGENKKLHLQIEQLKQENVKLRQKAADYQRKLNESDLIINNLRESKNYDKPLKQSGSVDKYGANKSISRGQLDQVKQENIELKKKLLSFENKVEECERRITGLKEKKRQLRFSSITVNCEKNNTRDEEDTKSLTESKSCPLYKKYSKRAVGGKCIEDKKNYSSSLSINQLPNEPKYDIDIVPTLNHFLYVINQFRSEKKYELAETMCKMYLENSVETKGHSNEETSSLLNILTEIYRDQSKYKQLATLLDHVFAIQDKPCKEELLEAGITSSKMAVTLIREGKFDVAEPYCELALNIKQKFYGDDHPEVAQQLLNTAYVYKNQQRFDKVERYYQRLLKIYNNIFGQDHPVVKKIKRQLAQNYIKQGKLSEAERVYVVSSQIMNTNDIQEDSNNK